MYNTVDNFKAGLDYKTSQTLNISPFNASIPKLREYGRTAHLFWHGRSSKKDTGGRVLTKDGDMGFMVTLESSTAQVK